jgi:hypothetical protein
LDVLAKNLTDLQLIFLAKSMFFSAPFMSVYAQALIINLGLKSEIISGIFQEIKNQHSWCLTVEH